MPKRWSDHLTELHLASALRITVKILEQILNDHLKLGKLLDAFAPPLRGLTGHGSVVIGRSLWPVQVVRWSIHRPTLPPIS
jgi:hypothetical protein